MLGLGSGFRVSFQVLLLFDYSSNTAATFSSQIYNKLFTMSRQTQLETTAKGVWPRPKPIARDFCPRGVVDVEESPREPIVRWKVVANQFREMERLMGSMKCFTGSETQFVGNAMTDSDKQPM